MLMSKLYCGEGAVSYAVLIYRKEIYGVMELVLMAYGISN